MVPVSALTQQLRALADGLVEAARKDAIEPDGTLGHWVQSQAAILHALADLAEHVEQQFVDAVSEFHNLGKVEVQKLREMNGLAKLAFESARSAEAGFHVQKEKVLTKVVETMVPQMVKAVGEAVVIRERRYNQRVHWGRAAGIAAVAGGLLLGGYVWRGFASDAAVSSAASSAAVLAQRVRQCQAAPVLDETTREAFCPLKSLVAP